MVINANPLHLLHIYGRNMLRAELTAEWHFCTALQRRMVAHLWIDYMSSQETTYQNLNYRHTLRPSDGVEIFNSDVIMSAMASPTISVSSVYSTVCSIVDHRKLQMSALLAFVRGIHRWPSDDIIMTTEEGYRLFYVRRLYTNTYMYTNKIWWYMEACSTPNAIKPLYIFVEVDTMFCGLNRPVSQ